MDPVDGSRTFGGELESLLDEAESVAAGTDNAWALVYVNRVKAMAAGARGDRAEMDRRLTALRPIAERALELGMTGPSGIVPRATSLLS